jgi:hypothetical protein
LPARASRSHPACVALGNAVLQARRSGDVARLRLALSGKVCHHHEKEAVRLESFFGFIGS